jgi:hypothetical protein
MTVECLLYPEIVPGDLVQVTSKSMPKGGGLFKVQKTLHEGDTHGHPWFTRLEISPWSSTNTSAGVSDTTNPVITAQQAAQAKVGAEALATLQELGLAD